MSSIQDSKKRSILRTAGIFGLVALFLLVFVLVYCYVQNADSMTESLTTSAQKLTYGLIFGGMIAGLTTWLVGVLTGIFPATARKHSAWFWPVVSGLLTLLVMGLGYVFLGVWPIGEKSVMLVDMHHQYGPLLNELRDGLLHGGNIFYDFNLGIGGSFLPMFGYYLASPLNLLLCLFPERLLTEGIFFITMIKTVLCGAGFAACVQYIFRKRSPLIPAVAVMYASSIYMIAYSWNIMWLDGVLMLPFVVMAFEHLMRTGRYLPYVLSLAYALFCNYYIGFMLCIFLVLYFFTFTAREKHSVGQLGKSTLRFALGSLLGGGLSMCLLLPVAMSLGTTSAAGGELPELASNFDMFSFFYRFLYGTEPTIRSGNLPNLYCGILALFLLPIFVTTKKIPVRRRIVMGSLLAFMSISCILNRLDLLWHGLHAPNDLPYRFSFIVIFVLLLIGYETLQYLQDVRPWQIGLSLALIAAYLILTEKQTEDISFKVIFVSLGLTVGYAIITALIAYRKVILRAGYILMLLLVTVEMTFHAGSAFVQLNHNEYFTRHEDYVDNAEFVAAEDAIADLKDAAKGEPFTRMGLLPSRTCVDTALFHYSGISVFASSNAYSTTRFMGSIGYAINGVNSYLYHSFVPMTDALFSMKYLASQDEINSPYLTEIDSSDDNYHLYESSATLPLAWNVQDGTEGWKWQYYNPIRSINTLYQAMADIDEDLLSYTNLELYPGDEEVATVNGSHSFSIRPKNNKSTDASYYSTIETTAPYFVYVDCRAADDVYIEVRGTEEQSFYGSTGEPYMSYLGILNPDDEVKVTVTSKTSASGNIYVVSLNEKLFNECLEKLNKGGLQITSFADDHIVGTMSSDTDTTVMTSITYDVGWTVKVDGKEVETFGLGKDNLEDVNSALLMFKMPAGEHEVEFVFRPKGLLPGIAISVAALIALVLLVLYTRKRITPEPDDVVYPEGERTDFDEEAFLKEFAEEIAEDEAAEVIEAPETSAETETTVTPAETEVPAEPADTPPSEGEDAP